MYPHYNLDLENTVFVIDSTTMAFMVSILSGGKPVKYIIERKCGIDTDEAFDRLVSFTKASVRCKKGKIIEIPPVYFVLQSNPTKTLKNLISFRKETKHIKLPKAQMYVGPPTSSIMNILNDRISKEIKYLCHGTGDYFSICEHEKVNLPVERTGLKGKIRKFLVNNVLNMPYSRWNGYYCYDGFTMCRLPLENVIWIDYNLYSVKKVEDALNKIKILMGDKNNIMLLAVSYEHTIDGVDPDTTFFNEENIRMLKSCTHEGDTVFVKFHPYVYRMNGADRIKNTLCTEIEKTLKAKAYDICELIPKEIGGPQIPLEAILRYIRFDCVCCRESAFIWNINADSNVRKYIHLNRLEDKVVKSRIDRMVKILGCDRDESYIFVE